MIPGLGRSPGEEKGYPLQHSGLKNSMDCIVHGVAKSRSRLRDFHLESVHSVAHSGLPSALCKQEYCRAQNQEGNGNPLQYSCLENPMDRGVLQTTVCGVTTVGHDLATKAAASRAQKAEIHLCGLKASNSNCVAALQLLHLRYHQLH